MLDALEKRRLREAGRLVQEVRARFPVPHPFHDLAQQVVKGGLQLHDQLLDKAAGLSGEAAHAVYDMAFRVCADSPHCRPRPVSGLQATAEAMGVRLSWHPSPSPGEVTYCVHRKIGIPPAYGDDGIVVADRLMECQFLDPYDPAGARTCYAVFARRGASLSEPVAVPVVCPADLKGAEPALLPAQEPRPEPERGETEATDAKERHAMQVVVAIDFGTARSGYAFAFARNPEVFVRTDWPAQPVPYVKTLSQLLYNPVGAVVAWGYEAPKRQAELRRMADREAYRLLRNFKMQIPLLRKENADPILDVGKHQFRLLDVVAAYLEKLRQMVMDQLQGGTTGVLRDNEVHWCLTVPAIWEDRDKDFMKAAARRAGLIGEGKAEDERLLLVLEPEAAAIYCADHDRRTEVSALNPGTRFMVVDAGGGTVDLTAYEVTPDGLCELAPGTGGACGSTFIDEQFEKHVGQLFGEGLLTHFQTHEPVGFLRLMEEWERAKLDYLGKGSGPVYISIPRELGRILDEPANALVLQRLCEAQGGDDANIHLTPSQIASFFRPVVDQAAEVVEQQFQALKGERCDYLFLVGGFARSPVLQDLIRERFGNRVVKVVVPEEPAQAVVAGAVLFGLSPRSQIVSRRMRRTYGYGGIADFLEGTHKPEKKQWNEDQKRWECTDLFSALVEVGDTIQVGQSITKQVYPTRLGQRKATIRLYSAPHRGVQYIDEPDVVPVGKVIVEMPDTDGELKRPIDVTMYLGQTEIRVEARDVTSGNVRTTTIEYQ